MDFYDTSFSLANHTTNTSCCTSDNQLLSISCGRGLSCAGQCSALQATLCPTNNCTGDPRDCQPNMVEEGRERGVAPANLPSWVFSWCTSNCRWVSYYPACCYNPKCLKKKARVCKRLKNYLGLSALSLMFTNHLSAGSSCPQPANIPHGTWTCRQQEIPIPGYTFLQGEVSTYSGTIFKGLNTSAAPFCIFSYGLRKIFSRSR